MGINMEKKIRIERDGSINITYGPHEKIGRCINAPNDFCGVWCPLFPVPSHFDDGDYLLFSCHGGYVVKIAVEMPMEDEE